MQSTENGARLRGRNQPLQSAHLNHSLITSLTPRAPATTPRGTSPRNGAAGAGGAGGAGGCVVAVAAAGSTRTPAAAAT